MKHELSLPSTGKKVTYRPFLVKEEKILMMAMQGGETTDIVRTLRDIIESCVESELNVKSLTMFDIEYVFLQLRARSVGDKIPVSYTLEEMCEKTDKKCQFDAEVNIDEIKVEKKKNHKDLIDITDKVKVKMKYPEIEMASKLSNLDKNETIDATFTMIGQCIEYIMDGEEIHKPTDYTEKELDDFINSLSSEQFKSIQQFFDTMPKLRHKVVGKCAKCGKEDEKVLEGMADFFV
tara:strand:+ start:914 stop:1618 length:705 start_codon:yes stop_codon:yes gene_type:complete